MALLNVACGGDDNKNDNDKEEQEKPAVTAENTADLCSDNLDNDKNGQVDCADPGCVAFAFCQQAEEGKENTLIACMDKQDNDGDGNTDCDDDECKAFAICAEGEEENTLVKCQDGKDNNKNGLIDCEDPECKAFSVCGNGNNNQEEKPKEEKTTENDIVTCYDGEDNDGDGKTDCCDEGCKVFAFCTNACADDKPEPKPEDATETTLDECTDGEDNDGDGKIDCLDAGCKVHEICAPLVGVKENTRELCSDGLDNDYSGEADCADPSCKLFCINGGATGENSEILCTDDIDNDGDGKKDCADPECADYDFCQADYPKDDPSKDECPNDPYKFKDDPSGKCGCGKTLIGEDCYTNITTTDELRAITGKGKYLIKRDLDFGTTEQRLTITDFGGTLDGNNKRITGVFNIKGTGCSLFSVPDTTSVFKNIDLAITINCDHVTGEAADVLAGGLFASFGGTATNITGSSKIFVEEEYNSTTTCSVTGGSSSTCTKDTTCANLNKSVGGLFGQLRETAKVSNINVIGNVSAQFRNYNFRVTSKDYRIRIGGVTGYAQAGATLSNVHANAFVTLQRYGITYEPAGMYTYVGGIIGQSEIALDDVHNEGTIRFDPKSNSYSTGTYIGGVVGQAIAVTNSSFDGRIVVEKKIADSKTSFSSYDYGTNIGGIAGRIVKTSTKGIDHCQVNAYLEAPSFNSFIGGIVGYLDSRNNNVYVRNSSANIDLVLRKVDNSASNYGFYGGIAGLTHRMHSSYQRTGYIINNSARTNYIQEEDHSPSTSYFHSGIAGICATDGAVSTEHGGTLVNNFISDKITCPNSTCYYTPFAAGGNHVYETYWNGDLFGAASGAIWYEDASAEPYTFNAEGIPVTRNGKTVLGLLRYNSGHDGGVLSTNIPNDGTYLDWTTIVDADGHVIPVPVDTNVPVN